ncbi:hypothetical protein ACNOYE_27680 [Nannocystaceae bacterium ST9]
MSSEQAQSAQAVRASSPKRLLRFVCALLCVAITFSLTAFLVGGPLSSVQRQTEVGRHDTIDVGNSTPTTWFRRGGERIDKCAVGFDLDSMIEDEHEPLLEVSVQGIDEPPMRQAEVAHATPRQHAPPVRGPPRVDVRA